MWGKAHIRATGSHWVSLKALQQLGLGERQTRGQTTHPLHCSSVTRREPPPGTRPEGPSLISSGQNVIFQLQRTDESIGSMKAPIGHTSIGPP